MKWKTWNKSGERRYERRKWRKWFAWYPVVISIEHLSYSSICKHWVWFKWVERRAIFHNNSGWRYEYRKV